MYKQGELAAELVSKTPWSEARDVWLKLGLLSVCHPDLTRGELFVGCVSSVCLCALHSAVTGDEPCHVAAGDREPFLLSNPDGASTWKTFHLSCCCLLSLPSSLSLSVDVKGYNCSSDTETERVNLSLLFPCSLFFLSCFVSYYFLPPSRSSIVSFYDQPSLLSALLASPPSLPPSLWLIDLSWVSGGKYKSSHCHFKQRDNQTLGCPLTTQGNRPWLWLFAPLSPSLCFASCSYFLWKSLSLSLSLFPPFLWSSPPLSSSSSTPPPLTPIATRFSSSLLFAASCSCVLHLLLFPRLCAVGGRGE